MKYYYMIFDRINRSFHHSIGLIKKQPKKNDELESLRFEKDSLINLDLIDAKTL